jgi:hypothetical protein
VFAGVGGTWYSDTRDMGFTYEAPAQVCRHRMAPVPHVEPVYRWTTRPRSSTTWSAPPQHFIMNLAARSTSAPTRGSVRFIENFIHQQSTVDIAIYVGDENRR